jgi:transcriptional regulator with XRE-family HTH domain
VASGESPPTVALRLREALKQRLMSQRELARRLAGDDATGRRVENERRQIAKYLSGENLPSPEKAARMAGILDQPADFFQDADAGPPRRLLDQIVALRELTEEVRVLIDERLLPADDLEARLSSLEAHFEQQGQSQVKALKALTAGIAKLERQLVPQAHRASGESL